MSNPLFDLMSAEDRELLARALHERREERVPTAVRERLLARSLEEAGRNPHGFTAPMQLMPVPRSRWSFGLAGVGAVALGVLLFASMRGYLSDAATADAGGTSPDKEPVAMRQLGDRLFQSALFHAPAPLLAGAPPPPASSLFGERPFSTESQTWQVRRWDDLRAPPGEPAPHQLERGAVCLPLGGGQRVIGGWPWVVDGAAVPAPAKVELRVGVPYRLVFDAWAQEPLPAQVLIALGHARLPFSAAGGARVPVTSERQTFEVRFTAPYDDADVGVAFLATAAVGEEATRVCLGDVTLTPAP